MNWDQVKGKWKQTKGKAKERWGRLNDNDLDTVDGIREQLVGKIQERYGIARDIAENQADEFVRTLNVEDREALAEDERAIADAKARAHRAGIK